MLALYSRNMLCIILEYSLSRIFATVVPVRSNSDLGGSVRPDRAEDRQADLPMQILIGRGDVAAAEPDADDAGRHLDRGVADHLRIPRLVAAEDAAELPPVDAIGGARQAQAAVLGGVAAGVEHPIETVRIPYGRLAQTRLIGRARVAPRPEGGG